MGGIEDWEKQEFGGGGGGIEEDVEWGLMKEKLLFFISLKNTSPSFYRYYRESFPAEFSWE